MPFEVSRVRAQFPALSREVNGRPAVFFDGPAGSQVPSRVIDSVAGYLANTNANHGGAFATSVESDAVVTEARSALASLLGASDPDCVVPGPNMTSLAFALGRVLARDWSSGDEIIVCRSDHDANFTPWKLAARDAGAKVLEAGVRPDGSLDLDDLRAKLSSRTRFVAVGCASNAFGTVQPFEEVVEAARSVGALVFLDAVHFAPHRRMAVESWGADFVACSAYKFFGPHVGILWAKREHLESLVPYKVRPAAESLPDRWMNGTQNHEGIAGAGEAVRYIADLADGSDGGRSLPERLDAAYRAIDEHESNLVGRLLEGLAAVDGVETWGILDPGRAAERVATVSFRHARAAAHDVAARLAEEGVFSWSGNFYAQPLTEALGLEPDGLVRVGMLHYNTAEEVDRLIDVVRRMGR